jgi:GNAT superfamily N-acetyltransferase
MSGALTISLAAEGDVDTVLDLIEELFDPPGVRPPDYERQAARQRAIACLRSPTSDALLAHASDGTPVGLATVYIDVLSIRQGRRCWVEEMVVSPPYRSRGVGAELLRAADEWARQKGCSHLELHSGLGRKDAHRFYLKQEMAQVAYVFARDLRV